MQYKSWNLTIKNNFNNAANTYDNYSVIQKYFSKQIIMSLNKLKIPKGEWFDLGCGTGYLADLIESKYKNQNVGRIDFSKNMLLKNKKNSRKILWDLNFGLPHIVSDSSLFVSSFCLHWLNKPEKAIKQWFEKLAKGGFLIIAFPAQKSFPEWRETCMKNNFEYSGIKFPNPNLLKSNFKENEIYSINEYTYTESFTNTYKLFKSIVNVGAQSSKSARKTVKELKMMQKEWPKDSHQKVNLTWNINIFTIQK